MEEAVIGQWAGIYQNGLKRAKEVDIREIERLHAAIGKLKMENDCLQQASARLM